ncbi:type IX secretion system protein PorQ [Marinoscillum sp.]|uniref:type IX secretion system protein PorQ n=1 Tax=Marinoscillum sp. TaxID=2024838 RepID=UPI003BAD6346
MKWLPAILTLLTFSASAQFDNYQSLQTPFGARNAALGGKVVSLADGDLMQFVHNPAVLDSVAFTDVAINFSPLFAGVYSFSGAYAGEVSRLGKLAFGVSYLDYGDFVETDPNGAVTGSFQARDIVLVVGKSHHIGSFALGGNLKYASNGIAGYGSSLLLGDFGGIYRAPDTDFTVGLVFKNFGFVLSDFTGSGAHQVPFDVQISTSVKPTYMPFRFSISAYNLVQNNMYFSFDEEISKSKTIEIADRIFRHVNVGAEFIIHKNLQFLFGYSHLRRQELKVGEEAYGAGLSFGLALGIKQFQIRYSHATYHAAGGTDFFTIQSSLNSFRKIL